MKSFTSKLCLGIFILLANLGLCQPPWPVLRGPLVGPPQRQGVITGAIGEYRQTSGTSKRRLHAGMDVISTENGNKNVFAIKGGTITNVKPTGGWGNVLVEVDGIEYRHIDPETGLRTGLVVQAGDKLGTMNTGGKIHVHMAQTNSARQNYLVSGFEAAGFLYGSSTKPYLKEAYFYKDPHTYLSPATNDPAAMAKKVNVLTGQQTISATEVYGKIDVVVNAYDDWVNGSGGSNNGGKLTPFSTGYSVLDKDEKVVKLYTDQIIFDGFFIDNGSATSKAHAVLVHGQKSSMSNPFLIVTNKHNTPDDIPTEDNLDTQKDLPDEGLYYVEVRAKNIAASSTAGISSFNETTKKFPIYVNNYQAYVQQVRVLVDGVEKYKRAWTLNKTQARITPDGTGASRSMGKGKTMVVEVTTSERIQSLQLTLDGTAAKLLSSKVDDGISWVFELPMPDLSKNPTAEKILTFAGKTLEGTALLQLSKTDTQKEVGRLNGEFISPVGSDTYHVLSFCTSTNSTLDLNFDKLNETSVRVKATGGKQPYEYRIGSQDFTENSDFAGLSADQTYQFTVKDDEGCQKSKEYSFKKSACSIAALSGGQGGATNDYELGTSGGTVRIAYQMYSIPDQMDVYYNGGLVTTTGRLVSGASTLQFAYNPKKGDPTQCRVNMIAPNNGTQWDYTLYCPVGTGPGRLSVPDVNYTTNYELTSTGSQLRLSPKSTIRVGESYQLLYRYVGESIWTEKPGITLPHTLALTEASREVEVQLVKQEETLAASPFPVRLYPNPTAGELTLRYEAPKAGLATVVVQSLKGQVLFEHTWTVVEGANQRQLIMPVGVGTGQYVLKLQQDDAIHATPLLLVR